MVIECSELPEEVSSEEAAEGVSSEATADLLVVFESGGGLSAEGLSEGFVIGTAPAFTVEAAHTEKKTKCTQYIFICRPKASNWVNKTRHPTVRKRSL